MGRTIDLFIALGTIAVALFGLGSGTFIYIQYSGAAIGLLVLGLSAFGGLLGAAKFVRTRGDTSTRRSHRHVGDTPRRF